MAVELVRPGERGWPHGWEAEGSHVARKLRDGGKGVAVGRHRRRGTGVSHAAALERKRSASRADRTM